MVRSSLKFSDYVTHVRGTNRSSRMPCQPRSQGFSLESGRGGKSCVSRPTHLQGKSPGNEVDAMSINTEPSNQVQQLSKKSKRKIQSLTKWWSHYNTPSPPPCFTAAPPPRLPGPCSQPGLGGTPPEFRLAASALHGHIFAKSLGKIIFFSKSHTRVYSLNIVRISQISVSIVV